jgi:hypothetical protein
VKEVLVKKYSQGGACEEIFTTCSQGGACDEMFARRCLSGDAHKEVFVRHTYMHT